MGAAFHGAGPDLARIIDTANAFMQEPRVADPIVGFGGAVAAKLVLDSRHRSAFTQPVTIVKAERA